jgi:anhydro-N-acetylmuramic acid kinase
VLYVGLISGTSRDGIDAVVADIDSSGIELLATTSVPYAPKLRAELDRLIDCPDAVALNALGRLHAQIGEAFASAALTVIEVAGKQMADVRAIGSHGQTIRHGPDFDHAFSLQIGDASRIAERTGIDTVADFRSADIAAGGEGAPLAPPFHRWLAGAGAGRTAFVNIGGIANVTLIGEDRMTGFDTGPGNTLMDAWIRQHEGHAYDDAGRWAAGGRVIDALLDAMLCDPYFKRPPPKSTGFEYFNLDWLGRFGSGRPQDVQATLLELTARTIADAVEPAAPQRVFVCGGGAHNTTLMTRLETLLSPAAVSTTASIGLAPDWVEAAAFAWLAAQRIAGVASNAPDVTGARHPVSLGALYPAQR